ncbi:hypothetical protein R1flu_023117 [Riccia fluitans]|uniref:Uncharacterized protein n=1 Tax=Riccia fluitans TaxID=41844 RepID=A0ABD1XRL5_9MARC
MHLYSHFHEMENQEKEDSKKQKALIQTVSNSETKMEDEKEPKEEVPPTIYGGEANRSKALDQKIMMDYEQWEIRLERHGWETSSLFEAFHVEVGSVTVEAMACSMKKIFAPPPVAEVDIQPWKEMMKNLIKLLTEEQKKNKEVIEQCDYYEGRCAILRRCRRLRCGVHSSCKPREIQRCD